MIIVYFLINVQNYRYFCIFATPTHYINSEKHLDNTWSGTDGMDTLEKKYYKISEVAELLNIPASTLRFWEKSFTVINPKRNQHGTRFYTSADIDKIAMIHYLVKERGLKLEAAQEQIRANPQGVERRHRTVSRLKEMRTRVQAMLDALHSLR